MTSKPKNSRSFILQQKNSFTNYEDNYQTASDLDENSLFDDHRVPHFGGQQEGYRFSNDDLDSPLGDNMESDEEDEVSYNTYFLVLKLYRQICLVNYGSFPGI